MADMIRLRKRSIAQVCDGREFFTRHMPSASPIVMAIAAVLALAIVGAFVVFFRSTATLRGYQFLARDARAIAKALEDSEIFRDGSDLVISGNYRKLPAMVRFSQDEHTPGIYVRMGAPASFTLSVAPSGAQGEGRVPLRTSNQKFDLRFCVRSDYPTESRMLLADAGFMQCLEELCCSTRTFVGMSVGALELSELTIPESAAAHHVVGHLESLQRMAGVLSQTPGSEKVKLQQVQHDRSSMGFRAAVAFGLVLALSGLGFEVRKLTRPANTAEELPTDATNHVPTGIVPAESILIPRVQAYRLADTGDMDPSAVAWMKTAGVQPQARITGDFSGKGIGNDTAYLLVAPNGTRRIVLLSGGSNRYDADYPFVGAAARVPKDRTTSITWVGRAPENVDGDGLLITIKPDDPSAGVVLFTSGNRVVTGVPADYQSISLQ